MVDTPIHRSAVFLMLLLLPALMLSAACSSAETPDAFDSAYAELRAQGKSHEAATELATIQTDGVATSDAFDSAYAELRAQGKSHEAATELATIQTTGSETSGVFDSAYAELRAQGKSHEAATELATIQTADAVESNTDNTESDYAMDAVVVLARYSSSDSHESTQRGQAAEELKMRVQSRELDADHAMNLLDIIAPEASINKRREAAKELARLSRVEDWDGRNTLDAAEELTRLITGNRIDAEKRVKAATELVWRSKSGDLDADNALDLMNDVAPGLSINERIEAASNLVSLSKTESWGSGDHQAGCGRDVQARYRQRPRL